MNSTNETLLFDRFLITYDLCVFTCSIVMFVFRCTCECHMYETVTYLLTYLLIIIIIIIIIIISNSSIIITLLTM